MLESKRVLILKGKGECVWFPGARRGEVTGDELERLIGEAGQARRKMCW
jgi:hypothetical protein